VRPGCGGARDAGRVIDPPAVRIAGPAPVAEPPKPGFPLVATLAPVAVSGILFAVTGSPYMLLMAALGPVIALATFVDGRRQRRRAARQASARFEREFADLEGRVEAARDAERARRLQYAGFDPDWSAPPPVVLAVER